MATVVKDFKIKSGLVVEGTTGTINTYDILTKKQADQDYIIGLIGGTATSTNTADAVVKRDGSGNFAAGTITADLTGDVTGNVTGDVTGDLTGDVTGTVSDISNHDTDDLAEGENLYFTDTRAKDAVAAALGDGVEYESGSFNVKVGGGIEIGGGTGNEIVINRTTVDGWYDANGAAADALADAEAYADQAELDAVATAALDATTKADTAEDNANSYTDTKVGNTFGKSVVEYLGENYTTTANLDSTVDGYGYLKSADLSDYATQTYVNDAVDALVDGAPGLLDTLNEIAAAINDDANYATTITTALAGKQDELTAGSNIDITGDTISVTGLDTNDVAEGDNLYFTDARAVTANTGLWDTIGAAADAQEAAEDFATAADTTLYGTVTDDIATAKSEAGTIAQGYADTAEQNANNYADGLVEELDGIVNDLTTDDIAEGTNLYFTDGRAKTSAAELLTGATLTNITITGNGSGLTITAENGVADSTTDDLEEGEDNLYFLDSRAVDALEAVVPNFTAVEFNSVAKQVAAEATVATASTSNALTWAKADYRSAEFLVKIKQGNHTEVSKLVLTMDASDNIAITEYAMVGTNGDLGSYSAAVSGTDVALTVTTLNNNSDVMVVGTLLK
jgi:hypothetical protein